MIQLSSSLINKGYLYRGSRLFGKSVTRGGVCRRCLLDEKASVRTAVVWALINCLWQLGSNPNRTDANRILLKRWQCW
jgi:hypothetical protein